MPGLSAAQRTYQIKKLVERKMLHPIAANARQYTLSLLHPARALKNAAYRRKRQSLSPQPRNGKPTSSSLRA